jgi:hypothetical protein
MFLPVGWQQLFYRTTISEPEVVRVVVYQVSTPIFYLCILSSLLFFCHFCNNIRPIYIFLSFDIKKCILYYLKLHIIRPSTIPNEIHSLFLSFFFQTWSNLQNLWSDSTLGIRERYRHHGRATEAHKFSQMTRASEVRQNPSPLAV